jgi:hypothetical protein
MDVFRTRTRVGGGGGRRDRTHLDVVVHDRGVTPAVTARAVPPSGAPTRSGSAHHAGGGKVCFRGGEEKRGRVFFLDACTAATAPISVSTRLGSQLVVTFSRVVGFLEPRANSSKSNKYPDNRRARQNRSRATAVWGTRGSFRSRARRDGARASSNRATETRRAPTRERREGEPRNVRPTNRVFPTARGFSRARRVPRAFLAPVPPERRPRWRRGRDGTA